MSNVNTGTFFPTTKMKRNMIRVPRHVLYLRILHNVVLVIDIVHYTIAAYCQDLP